MSRQAAVAALLVGDNVDEREKPATLAGPDVIQAFAEAVARPGRIALLIDANNGGEEWVSIRDAVRSRRAFAVKARDEVLAVDDDCRGLAGATELLAAELREAQLVPVVLASGQPGHRHLFARVQDSYLRARLAARATQLGLDVRRCIRPPLAPHRLGLPVTLVDPPTVDEALRALRPIQVPRRLSAPMWWLLRYGDREGRYRTRSEAVMAVILGMVNAGWPEERVYQALTDPRNTAGEKVRDILDSRGELAARRYVRGRYEKAQQRVRVSPPIRDATDARRAIARVEQRADTHRWPGKAGGSARLVLQALLDIAALAGSLAFTASRRQIAEAAGLSRSASDSAISRLVDGRWLRCQRRGRGHLPSSWKVLEHRCGTCCTSGPLETYPFGGREGNGAFAQRLGHDVWRWRGLGKSAWRILGALDTAHGTTAANLAKRLKIDRSTVGRNLVKMADHNLARRDPDGRWRREKEFDLERVAQELGVAGVGDRQRTRHELERSWNWLKLGLRASPWTGEALGDAEAPLPERSSRASATLGVGTG